MERKGRRQKSEVSNLNHALSYWRTKSGQEVNFIVGDAETAIEVKGAARVDQADLRGLAAFSEEYKPRRALLVCNESTPRQAGKILVLPWRIFMEKLWSGEII